MSVRTSHSGSTHAGEKCRSGVADQHALLERGHDSIVKNDVEKRAVNTQFTVVFDKSHFAEAVHKEIHAGPGGANHLRQRFLAYPGNYRLRRAFLPKLG